MARFNLWLVRVCSVLLALCLGMSVWAAQSAHHEAVEVDQAPVRIDRAWLSVLPPDAVTAHDETPAISEATSPAALRHGAATAGSDLPGASGQWVRLPDRWSEVKRSGLWRYQVWFSISSPQLLGLYVPRVGPRFAIAINGHELMRKGEFDPAAKQDYSRQMQYVNVPALLLVSGRNQLTIDVQGQATAMTGLSTLWLGPARQIDAQYQQDESWVMLALHAALGVALVSGALAAALAFAMRERTFAYFFVAALCASVRLLVFLVTEPPIHSMAWLLLSHIAQSGFFICLSLFGLYLLDLPKRRLYRLNSMLLCVMLVTLPLYVFWHMSWAFQLYNFALLFYGLVIGFFVFRSWWSCRDAAHMTLGLATLLTLLAGLYDYWLYFHAADGFEGVTLSRFALQLFLPVIGGNLIYRMRQQVLREHQLRLELQRKGEERERLLRDVHDGLGLHLNGMLGVVEQPSNQIDARLQRNALMVDVRTAIDQLRLLVSNGQRFEGNWGMLFGTVRQTLHTRLVRFSITLDWRMADSPLLGRVATSAQALSLQWLLFELTTNVIKHAQATQVRVEITVQSEQTFVIDFSDNGKLVDKLNNTLNNGATAAGLGTQSIQSRVRDLNGQLQVQALTQGGRNYRLAFTPEFSKK